MTQRGPIFVVGAYAMRALAVLALLAFASAASAGRVLVIYGPITSASSAVTPLQNAGHQVDAVSYTDPFPSSLDAYDQVWDIRYSGNPADQPATVITGLQIEQYLAFLARGRRMFVLSDYNHPTRNDSILTLISVAGGGNPQFDCPGSIKDPGKYAVHRSGRCCPGRPAALHRPKIRLPTGCLVRRPRGRGDVGERPVRNLERRHRSWCAPGRWCCLRPGNVDRTQQRVRWS